MASLTSSDFEALSALTVRAQEGDGQAYQELLTALYPFVHAVIRARIGPVVDTDDVTQECLLAVHKSLATYHPSRPLRPWLMAIVRYKVADHFRALARKKTVALIEDITAVTNEESATNTPVDGPGEKSVDVRSLVAALPDPFRRAVELTKLKGISGSEAAKAEGITEAALRKRVSRAYKMLARAARQAMEQESDGE